MLDDDGCVGADPVTGKDLPVPDALLPPSFVVALVLVERAGAGLLLLLFAGIVLLNSPDISSP
jgi:hypothetical protein